MPFPGVCGRVCTHPCEKKCKRAEVDQAVSIMALKRTAAEFGKSSDEDLKIDEERGKRIAVVGEGRQG
jgi:NADH-quinone oxidoreductase subunit F